MSEISKLERNLNRSFNILASNKKNIFLACCNERFVEIYNEFTKKDKWGNFSELKNSLDLIWKTALKNQLSDNDISILKFHKSKIVEITPHSDDFISLESVLAQRVCMITYTTLEMLLGQDIKRAYEIVQPLKIIQVALCVKYTGHIDLYDTPEAEIFEKKVLLDNRFIKELDLQKKDLAQLKLIRTFDEELLYSFRQRANNNLWEMKDFE